jgi:dTDP-4-dehydrorhamnose 3,5-epimerase
VYKCSDYYDSESEVSLAWNDPVIGIDWPIDDPLLSEKDDSLPSIDEIDQNLLPIFSVI